MSVILVKKRKYATQRRYPLGQWLLLLSLTFALLTVAGVAYAAYHYGIQQAKTVLKPNHLQEKLNSDNNLQNCQTQSPYSIEAQLSTLTFKISQLQADLTALDTLGTQLVKIGKFQQEEFDFDVPWDSLIAKYDPDAEFGDDKAHKETIAEIKQSVRSIAQRLEDREEKLTTLEDLVRHNRRHANVLPSGWPLKQGYVSSHYGWRKSVRGKKRMHRGIDIVAKAGSNIYAVEAGEVTYSGSMRGYGKIVEIKHSDTYSTRYAHNKKNLVKKGDKIKKGQVIGLVGATGRATGYHVHFEVRQKSKAINPIKFLTAVDTFKLSENNIQ